MSSDPRLPPHQTLTRKFPVVGERAPSPAAGDLAHWRLEISGLVRRPRTLDWRTWTSMPRGERRVDLHCVTGWSRFDTLLGGLPLAGLLASVEPLPEAGFVRFEAYSKRRHDTSLPLDAALADTWLVDAIDGEPLSVEHGGPLRTVTPSRYFYKSLKWLHRIELLAEDRLGYWERESSYHNVGDPWPGDQRFSTGSIDPRELSLLRAGRDLSPWRHPRKVVLAADLRDWSPRDRDLRGIQLKSCNLRGAALAEVDLRGANLSLSDLRGATLVGARLADADLEGADLAGADLSHADLSGCALSATRFFDSDFDPPLEARVDGLILAGANGLLESQETFLRRNGIKV